MPENDQYPTEAHGTKMPVAVLLAAVITVAVGAFAFTRSDDATDPTITGGIRSVVGSATPTAAQKPVPSPP